ncbi:MAG: response regulator [Candidatus Latescibacteria bacterium]|jgi:hypothetical protein|nr:response regulator [Candidatus Latescibacterota bacterium]
MSIAEVPEKTKADAGTAARILVVEDEGIIASHIQVVLIGAGYEVVGMASYGEEAIRKAEEARPDLVLMDIMLRGQMDGVEAAGQIRERLDIPVIYLTAYADDETLARAKIAEPFGYILKPFERRELQTAIEMALYKHAIDKRLRDHEQWLATTLHSIGDAVVTVDNEGRVKSVNPIAERLTGWKAHDAIGSDIVDCCRLEDDASGESAAHPVLKALCSGASVRFEDQVMISADGRRVPVEGSAAPLRGVDGRVEGVVLACQDVTARKQAEEAREAAERELVEQRALSMRADRLRSLGEMAAGMAHELSQPLMGVRGLAEHILIGMQRGWDLTDERLRSRLDRIIEQADRMVHIIDHVRMFAREAKNPETTSVEVNDVVRSAVEFLGAQLGARGIQVKFELSEDLPAISANPFSLEEVILNLLTNARDAVVDRVEADPKGPPGHVMLSTGSVGVSPGSGVSIDVTDNGGGISEAVRAQAFDPFFTTKDPDKGTGLGLSISKSIVEQFDGTIRIHSSCGGGTTFRLCFPALYET